jgi:hypothetical protein
MGLGVDYPLARAMVELADKDPGKTIGGPDAMIAVELEPPDNGYIVAGDGKPDAPRVYDELRVVRSSDTSGLADDAGNYATIKAIGGGASWNTTLTLPELVTLRGKIDQYIEDLLA